MAIQDLHTTCSGGEPAPTEVPSTAPAGERWRHVAGPDFKGEIVEVPET
jgi:hypothetical protein